MAVKFGVRWDHICFICKNPLDVRIDVTPAVFDDVCYDISIFCSHHPTDLSRNHNFMKVREGKAYRCCKWCFDRPWPIPNLRSREVGVRPRRIDSGSLSDYDIYIWFKSLYTYLVMDKEGKFKKPGDQMGKQSGILLRLVNSF